MVLISTKKKYIHNREPDSPIRWWSLFCMQLIKFYKGNSTFNLIFIKPYWEKFIGNLKRKYSSESNSFSLKKLKAFKAITSILSWKLSKAYQKFKLKKQKEKSLIKVKINKINSKVIKRKKSIMNNLMNKNRGKLKSTIRPVGKVEEDPNRTRMQIKSWR